MRDGPEHAFNCADCGSAVVIFGWIEPEDMQISTRCIVCEYLHLHPPAADEELKIRTALGVERIGWQ